MGIICFSLVNRFPNMLKNEQEKILQIFFCFHDEVKVHLFAQIG